MSRRGFLRAAWEESERPPASPAQARDRDLPTRSREQTGIPASRAAHVSARATEPQLESTAAAMGASAVAVAASASVEREIAEAVMVLQAAAANESRQVRCQAE